MLWRCCDCAIISIHALRKESDGPGEAGREEKRISIHALRKESDTSSSIVTTYERHFNPRSP